MWHINFVNTIVISRNTHWALSQQHFRSLFQCKLIKSKQSNIQHVHLCTFTRCCCCEGLCPIVSSKTFSHFCRHRTTRYWQRKLCFRQGPAVFPCFHGNLKSTTSDAQSRRWNGGRRWGQRPTHHLWACLQVQRLRNYSKISTFMVYLDTTISCLKRSMPWTPSYCTQLVTSSWT